MNYQEFMNEIKNHIQNAIPSNYKVMVQPILKNNNTVYDGLIITDPALNISPTIYLNPYYHRYLDGVSLEDIYEDILKTYEENLPIKDFDISIFTEYENAKKRIVMKLVNKEKNKTLLEDVPYISFHDLAILFVCSVTDFMEEYATILIHNEHLKLWNVSTDELFEVAKKNTPKLLLYNFDKMEKLLEHLIDKPLPYVAEIDMYVLTNHLKINGATCIVYPQLLKKIANRLEDNLIIIPSSIHEVIIIPEKSSKNTYTLSDYNNTIIEVNETQLTDDEILSNHAYLYNRETEELSY